MNIPQTLFVFGHEMGHYVLNHIWKGIGSLCLLFFVLFYLGFRAVNKLLDRWGERLAIRGVGDFATLPLLLLILSVFLFLSSPVLNTFSRHLEHQADIYGLEVTHGITPQSPEVAAQAFQILGEIDLADPDPNPFIEFWLYSHPALNERLVFAQTYDPWSHGKLGR